MSDEISEVTPQALRATPSGQCINAGGGII